ncbi:DUF6351 family protein, partial [Nonomuraea sp. NPDC004297]
MKAVTMNAATMKAAPVKVMTALAVLASLVAAPAPAHASRSGLRLEVLSSRPDQVTGGDALIRVGGARDAPLKVLRDGADVTAAFRRTKDGLTGLVTGLADGDNTITATAGPHRRTLKIRNHAVQGPVFSGEHQYPFLCKTERAGLGPPVADNQDGQGMRVTDGWSRDCFAP